MRSTTTPPCSPSWCVMAEGWADPPTAAVPTPMSLEEPTKVIGIERRTTTIAELWLRPRGGALEHLAGEDVLLEDRKRGFRRGRSRPTNGPAPGRADLAAVTRVPDGET